MMADVFRFVVVLVFFMLPYGIAQNNYLYPNMLTANSDTSSVNWNRVVNLLTMSYFHVFGEIFPDQILDMAQPDYEGCGLANSPDSKYLCPERSALSSFILALYLLVANILLLNMLIAIFTHTYNMTLENSKEIWIKRRYELILGNQELLMFTNTILDGAHSMPFLFFNAPVLILLSFWTFIALPVALCKRGCTPAAERSGRLNWRSFKDFLILKYMPRLIQGDPERLENRANIGVTNEAYQK